MMNKEDIEKLFKRIELDKLSDSCGFEFADGFSCTFDNVATCYDDRLKLYGLVKDLQQRIDKAIEYINDRFTYEKDTGAYYITHTFDGTNIFELWEILQGDDSDDTKD